MHHVYKRKHHWVNYIHILFLLIIFYLYNITTFAPAEDITDTPTTETPIVIQNEPQITPDISTEVIPPIEAPVETPADVSTGVSTEVIPEVVSGTTEVIPEVVSGTTTPAEQISGVVITGEVGDGMISGDMQFFSGVLNDLSGETLHNISGEVIGTVNVQSGDIIPVDLSGVSLITQTLSTVFPTQLIQINGSGFIELDSLESVTTTGGAVGVTYCSRIAYDNISSILKAGVWTWRQTNNYILQGDAEQILNQGITDKTVIEVSSGDLEKIFTGDTFALNAQIYDIYIDFISHGEKVYHRVTFIYTDDPAASDGTGGQRYVLDPLRGARTTAPQKISDYLVYYTDETDVHRYIGQGYSPSVIKEGFTVYENIMQLLQQLPGEILSTGNNLTGEILSGEILSGEIFTGEQNISTGSIDTGNILPVEEVITGTVDTGVIEVVPEVIPEVISETPTIENMIGGGSEVIQPQEVITGTVDIGVIDILTGEEIITGYFTKAYDRGVYSEKIIELQNILNWLQLYEGNFDGVYSDSVMASVYQYQLKESVLTPQDPIGLRGYLGPKTRIALNASYVEYQLYKISLEQQIIDQAISTGILSTGTTLTETGGLLTGGLSTGNVIIPISGQETLNTIGTMSGVNTVLLFDPLTNPLLFSGLLNTTGYQQLLSGYTTGEIALTFATGTRKEIIKYLRDMGYETGVITLVSISNSETLVGDVKLDLAQFSGMLLVPVILQSTNELNGNIAEVSLPEGTLFKNTDGEEFTGEIAPPVFLDPAIIEQQVDQEVISVIDVGADQHVEFEDASGNAMFATFRVPAPGMNIGDTIDINYSEDGVNWIYMNSVNVQDIDGEPYAIFEANHFTTFYLGNTTGTFVINNDATYATGLAVTLNSSVSGMTQMRFGNTIAERDGTGWITYTGTKSWNLTGTDEIKRVYAQFSGNSVVRNVSDSIIYDISTGAMKSGLQLHLNASTGGTRFFDIGPRNLFFTGIGGAYKTTWSGEEVIGLNGTSQYIENFSGFITAYPFTISAWVKPTIVAGIQTIAMFGNSGTNTTYYGLRLNGANAVAVGMNTTLRTATGTTTLVAGQRYHIVGVFLSGTSRTIYVDNGTPVTNTLLATFSATNPRRRISRHPGLSTTNYFSGMIDEVRVYNTALTTGERQNLFMVPPTFDTQTAFTGTPTLYGTLGDKIYSTNVVISGITYATTGDGTGKWKTSPMITGLANGIYTVTLNYTNVYGKTGTTVYTSGLIINSTGVNITYNPSTTTTGNVVATLTGLDPTYMIVNNSGSELYTFTINTGFTWQYVDKQGTTGNITANVTWIKSAALNYSTGIFNENSTLNNGSIAGNIIATLSTGTFSGAATNYVTLSNVPAGLTGVFTLSGTQQIIISLSGTATNHYATDSTGNIIINFLTGAFVNMNPSDVINSTQTGISVSFIDPAGYLPGQQLWLKGILSGGQFYDYSPVHHVTTGVGGPTSVTQSGETMMSFNGADQYISVGTYTLTGNYSISARFKSNVVDGTRRSVVGDTAGNRELSTNTSNKISAYSNGTLASVTTIQANMWYHVVVVKNSTGTKIYINGVLDNSNASTTTLTNTNLTIGDSPFYVQPRNGNIDEVEIYSTELTPTQIENMYMDKPSFVAKTVHTDIPILTGLSNDTQMTMSLTISGTNYSVTNNLDGTRTSNTIGPLSSGTYNVQLNYTNVYGRTGMLMYTGGLIVDLSGVNIAPRASVTYSPTSGTYTTGNVIATLTGFNKTGITITNNSGLATYTFTGNGSFTFQFSDGSGSTGSTTATVDWIRKAVLNYSTGIFYEDSTTNTGSITGNIIATLSTGTFSGAVTNYITMTNVPAGLTGVFTLSGTQQIIITLSGKALNHTSSDNVSNITINFATGAFVNMNPGDVVNSIQTGIAISFYDAPGFIAGQQLRINGTLSGGQFYDYSPNHRVTTGVGSIGNSTRSGETVMGPFNGSSQYVSVGSYTLTNYSISAWFKSDRLASWRTIVGQDGGTAFEMSQNTASKISFYDVSTSIASTTVLTTGQWYHVVRVQSGTNTLMYINGILEQTIAATNPLTNMALAIGKYSTASQLRSGNIDEVKIYDNAITATQVQNLYMIKPSFSPKTIYTSTGILTGLSNDTQMTISLTISGTNYSVTNNLDGTRTSSTIGSLINGTYDVQLNYTNVYGRTGVLIYTGGLIVSTDTIAPTATVSYSPTSGARTNQNVVATLTGISETITITNNGGSGVYIFTGNDSFIFEFIDLAGNTGSTTATVDWIDKTPPTFTGIITGGYYNTHPQIFFSDAYLSGATLSGLNNPYYSGDFHSGGIGSEDGRYLFTVYDLAGNRTGAFYRTHTSILYFSGITSGAIYNTNVSIEYRMSQQDPDCAISGAVLSGLNGNSYYNGNYQSGTIITGEGKYSFMLYEVDGDKTGAIFTIDRIAPVISGVISGGYYNLPTVEFSDVNLSGAILSGLDNSYYNGNFQSGTTITGDGRYLLTVYDRAGNNTGMIFTVDTLPPTFSGVETGIFYTGNVTISFADSNLSGAILSGIGNSYYSGNFANGISFLAPDGKFLLTVTDKAGNSTGATFRFHTSILGFTGVTEGGLYSGDVTIIYTFTGHETCWMSGVIVSGLNNGFYRTDNSSGYTQHQVTITGDGTYKFRMYEHDPDNTGVNSFTIDKTKPTATIDYIPLSGLLTSGNVLATITGFSETIIGLNTTGYTFTGNGTYVFTYTDLAGNTGSTTAIVNRIDITPPSITLLTPSSGSTIGSGTLFSRSGYDVSGISGYIFKVYNNTGTLLFSTGFTATGISLPILSYTYMTNGIYIWTVTATDPAGNSATSSSGIFVVDKTPPTITIVTTQPPFPIYNSGYNQDILFHGESDTYPVRLTLSLYNASGTVLGTTGEIQFDTSGSLIATFPGGVLPEGVYSYCGTARDIYYNLSGRCLGDVIVDKTPPTFTGIITGGYYNTHPQIFFSDAYLSGATLSGLNNPYYSGDFHSGGIGSEDGRYLFTVYDLAGNRTGAFYRTHTSILYFSGITSGAIYNTNISIDYWMTQQDPDCSISGAVLSGLNGNSYYNANYQSGTIITGEGKYSFMFYEVDGDKTGAIFTIDKTHPTASVQYIPDFGNTTGGHVLAILTGISEPITILNNDGSGIYEFTMNGNFTFEFIDIAGNTGELKVQVWRIKPGLGTLTGVELSTQYTSNSIYLGGYDTGVQAVIVNTVSITTGTLYKNGVAMSGLSTTGMRDDEFHIILNSSLYPLDTVISTLTIDSPRGPITGDFILTTKDIPLTISAPASFDFGTRTVSDSIQTIIKTFSGSSDYFKIVDRQGLDTGYYTTISMSDMTTASGDIISYTAVAVKALTGIVTLSGTDNPRMYSAITGTYQYFTASPLTFIARDTAANGGVMGTYGIHTIWKIDIPALQNIGNYTGVITYTLY